MNKTVIFLFIAIAILILTIICLSTAPIINDIESKFTTWGKGNCENYADIAKYTKSLDEKYKNIRHKNLCYRQNAMYGLEYSSFILDSAIGFICAQLALLHYFKIGKSFEKITGLIGLIGGAIGFILTLVYVSFSGYIFNNDVAFRTLGNDDGIEKLYPNGAKYKYEYDAASASAKIISVYQNEKADDSQFIKYKDLGDKPYNYNEKLYNAYYYNNMVQCKESSIDYNQLDLSIDHNCQYVYPEPENKYENKYLYDSWCLSLVLAVVISALNIVLLVFGFLLFKNSGDDSGEIQEVKIE